eukprot:TRINITY_DN1748_c0_g1_i3.p2 TRINITY_DN1748_c0_g1~~TRINITY_DN1748_c0_g1_i3.p2  ORF type:complete len:717 (+),score=252.18 TRINITY_DN1748_c0_g1_i3:2120-4270(+)
MGRPKTEDVLLKSLECLEGQLKMWQVVGNADEGEVCEAQDKIVKWLLSLRQIMYEPSGETLRVGVRDRVKSLVAVAAKRKKSMCMRLLQMSNAGVVAALNSAQQADYLRTSVTKQTKKLACRAKQKDEDLGFDDLCRRVVESVGTLVLPPEDMEADVSFYSQTSMCESLHAVKEMCGMADDLVADDLLKVAGGLGVPYRAAVAEYPDPWQYRITEMYTGMLINESDLWTAYCQGYGAALECPGRPESEITGVLPLDVGAGMKFYNTKMRDLAELQAAVCMRRKMARIPGDIIAREAAGVLYCAQQLGVNGTRPTNELEVASALLNSLAVKIHHSTMMCELTMQLREADDIRAVLIGRNEVSNILKPAVCLMRGMVESTRPCDRMLPEHCRALYELDAYHAARRVFSGSADRLQAVVRMLGVDVAAMRAESPTVGHLKEYVEVHARWAPSLESAASLFRVARLPPLVTTERLTALPGVGLCEAFDYEGDIEMYRVGVVLMSLECAKEQDRVKEGVACTPELTSDELVWRYIHSVAERVVQGLKEEASRKMLERLCQERSTAVLAELVSGCYGSFLKVLGGLDIKKSKECSKMLRMLLGREFLVITDAKEKLFYLLAGVGMDGTGCTITPCRHVMKHKQKVVRAVSLEYWNELLTAHSAQLMKGYTYREGSNRHKHGNDKPSFYALGYPSLGVMQDLDPHGYAEYIKVHVNCCGFGRR